MKIAIVVENDKDRNLLHDFLIICFREYNIKINNLCMFDNSNDFINSFKKLNLDLVFLDVNLKDTTGIQIAKYIRKYDDEVNIVFYSQSNEYASESYNLKALYYICKPVNRSHIESIIQKIEKEQFENNKFIVLPDGKKVKLSSLVCAEYNNHYITFKMTNDRVFSSKLSIKKLIELLEPYKSFVLCSRNSIINLKKVVDCKNDYLLVNNGHLFSISKSNAKKVKEKYADYLVGLID